MLTVRWAVGSPMKRPLQEKSVRMFAASLAAARSVWPNARRIVQVNNGPEQQRARLLGIARAAGCEAVDGLELLVDHPNVADLKPFTHTGRAWWKFLPPRFDPDSHELFLDADNVIWEEPRAIREWRRDPHAGVLGHADVGESNYDRHVPGPFEDLVPKDLSLNSGLFGFGPGVPFDPPLELSSMPNGDYSWGSDQGFVALNFVRRGTHRVSMDEVRIPFSVGAAQEAVADPTVKGVHFAGHSVQQRDFWTRFERDVLDRVRGSALNL